MATGRALVVDDSPASLRLLRSVISSTGLRVTCAHGARSALALHAERPFDVIVTDWIMPDMDGLELIRALRATADTTPVLAVSGLVDEAPRILCARFENVAWLTKPLVLKELSAALQDLLRQRSQGQSATS